MDDNLNEIVLRPRFKLELDQDNATLLSAFETSKTTQEEFIISRIDDHVFIKLPKHKQTFWSPQLHIEINETEDKKSILYGLFGPNPTVWTLFMFLHFMVAGLCIAFCIWAYSNYALKKEYLLQVWGIIAMVILWFLLYLAGRVGKNSNKEEMRALYNYMQRILAQ